MWKRKGEEIKQLHAAGKSRKEIAAQLHVSVSCVAYHTNPVTRAKQLENSKKHKSNWHNTEAGRTYMRNYWRTRYHNDEEFRKKAIKAITENAMRKKNIYNETQKHLLETLLKENTGRYTAGDLWLQASKTMSRTMFNRFLNDLKERQAVTYTGDLLNWVVT